MDFSLSRSCRQKIEAHNRFCRLREDSGFRQTSAGFKKEFGGRSVFGIDRKSSRVQLTVAKEHGRC